MNNLNVVESNDGGVGDDGDDDDDENMLIFHSYPGSTTSLNN